MGSEMCIRDSSIGVARSDYSVQQPNYIAVDVMTPNSLVVLKSCVLDKNYVTVMHVPLSTPIENTFSGIFFFTQNSSFINKSGSTRYVFLMPRVRLENMMRIEKKKIDHRIGF